jgi:hypothetical protein
MNEGKFVRRSHHNKIWINTCDTTNAATCLHSCCKLEKTCAEPEHCGNICMHPHWPHDTEFSYKDFLWKSCTLLASFLHLARIHRRSPSAATIHTKQPGMERIRLPWRHTWWRSPVLEEALSSTSEQQDTGGDEDGGVLSGDTSSMPLRHSSDRWCNQPKKPIPPNQVRNRSVWYHFQ